MNRRSFLAAIGVGSGTLLSGAIAGVAEPSGESFATTGIPPAGYNPKTGDSSEACSSPVKGKIALEEHFALTDSADAAYQIQPKPTSSQMAVQECHPATGSLWRSRLNKSHFALEVGLCAAPVCTREQ